MLIIYLFLILPPTKNHNPSPLPIYNGQLIIEGKTLATY